MSCLSSRIEIFLHVLSSVCSLSLRFLLLLRVCWAIFPIFYEPWVCLDCVTNSSPTLLCGRRRNSFFNLQNLVSVELLCAQNGDLNLSNEISRKISVKIFFFSFYHFQSGEKLMNEERRFVTWNSRAGWGLAATCQHKFIVQLILACKFPFNCHQMKIFFKDESRHLIRLRSTKRKNHG